MIFGKKKENRIVLGAFETAFREMVKEFEGKTFSPNMSLRGMFNALNDLDARIKKLEGEHNENSTTVQ